MKYVTESMYLKWVPRIREVEKLVSEGMSRENALIERNLFSSKSSYYLVLKEMKKRGEFEDTFTPPVETNSFNSEIKKVKRAYKKRVKPEMLTLTVAGQEGKWTPEDLGRFLKGLGVIG